jgi:hypothetical protein
MDTKTNPEQAASASAVRTLSLADIVARSPDPITALDKLGFWLAKSGMFGCDRLEAGHVIALTCISEGLSPAEFFRTYHVLGGKVVKRAEAVLADFRRRGGAFRWVEDGTDGKTASAVFTFGGQEKTARYTLEDATKAGLVKAGSGWLTRPANMLRARVSTNGVRMLCPEVFGGEYDEETTSAPAPGLDLTATPAPTPITTAIRMATAPSVTDTGSVSAMISFTRRSRYCSDGPRSNTRRSGGEIPAAFPVQHVVRAHSSPFGRQGAQLQR